MLGINFNREQLNRLSEIFSNLGLLIVAAMVIPVFSRDGNITLTMFLSGTILFIVCGVESLILIGGGHNEWTSDVIFNRSY